jgi:PAS domain S-box-containing protein
MRDSGIVPTGHERTFRDDEIIVSKTDLKGHIQYANQTFLKISGYTEEELLGQPHNILRHPDMPRCLFKLLWETIQQGNEIFAYINNLAKNGDHYWVFAHVTPTFNSSNQIVGFHSNRRVPDRNQVKLFENLYRQLRAEEARYADSSKGMAAAMELLMATVRKSEESYEEFVFSV